MKMIARLLLAMILLPTVVAAAAEMSGTIEDRGGKTYVVLTNDYVDMTIDPSRGGRCVRLMFRKDGEQLIGNDDDAGMFLDHWAEYPYPSGLMHLPYEYELVGDGINEIGVRLGITVPAMGGGKGAVNRSESIAMPTAPHLVGLKISKTIMLKANSDCITVRQEVENATQVSRAVALYIQQSFGLAKRFNTIWYLPSGRGIEYNIQPADDAGRAIGANWVRDPTAGWMAVRNAKSGSGLMFVFDYNYLHKTYTSGATAEWWLDSLPLQPGGRFSTNYIIKRIDGFGDVVYGSNRVVADIQAEENEGGSVTVNHDIAAVGHALDDVEVEFVVTDWMSKRELAKTAERIGKLDADRHRQKFTFEPQALAKGVVIQARVRGADFEERYEYYYAGDKAEYERRYNPFSTQGQALPGAKGDAYAVKPPKKFKQFEKPDFATLNRPDTKSFKTLVVFGLYTHILNLDDALAAWRHKGNPVTIDWANCPPNTVENFPGSYEELFAYNTVVLSNVNYHALGDIRFEMVCDYVEHGGNLLVIGGPYAYGNGEFENTRFLEVLPVFLSGPFDLKWAGKGKSWDIRPKVVGNDPMLRDVSFAQEPKVFWHHFVTPKQGGDVVLEAGNQPVLVKGRYGQGKVAVLTLSPTGHPAEGETAWWDWDGWCPLVRNIFTWMNE